MVGLRAAVGQEIAIRIHEFVKEKFFLLDILAFCGLQDQFAEYIAELSREMNDLSPGNGDAWKDVYLSTIKHIFGELKPVDSNILHSCCT